MCFTKYLVLSVLGDLKLTNFWISNTRSAYSGCLFIVSDLDLWYDSQMTLFVDDCRIYALIELQKDLDYHLTSTSDMGIQSEWQNLISTRAVSFTCPKRGKNFNVPFYIKIRKIVPKDILLPNINT